MNEIKHILWLKFAMDKRQTEYVVGWGGAQCLALFQYQLEYYLLYSNTVTKWNTNTHTQTHTQIPTADRH